jgi:HSP20 family protein
MNTLNRWNWLRDLEAFQQSLDSLLRHSPTNKSERQARSNALPLWSPFIEISETDQEYLIKADLPQLTKDDVKVSAEPGSLTIVGRRKFDGPNTMGEIHEAPEPISASFARTFSLPNDASPTGVSAELSDGVLVVRMIKGRLLCTDRIEVKVS